MTCLNYLYLKNKKWYTTFIFKSAIQLYNRKNNTKNQNIDNATKEILSRVLANKCKLNYLFLTFRLEVCMFNAYLCRTSF